MTKYLIDYMEINKMAAKIIDFRILLQPEYVNSLFWIKVDYGDMVDKFRYLTESELCHPAKKKECLNHR